MMRPPARPKHRRSELRVTRLEDRTNPDVAFALSGIGLGTANLLAFDTATPSITQTTAIVNVAANETLVGMDFRPQNGQLYGLGVNDGGTGTLYNISTRTGRATPIGATGSVNPTSVAGGSALPNPAIAGNGFAFDFNPLVDKIRVLATDGQNFVIDQNTGLVVTNSPTLNGATTTGSGTAYTNNQPNGTATTQYTIDATSDALYLQIPATGSTTRIGAVTLNGATVDFSAVNGFDIPAGVNSAAPSGTPVTSGSAFAGLAVGGVSRLYTIDLTSGATTDLGTVGSGAGVTGLAVQNDPGGFPAVGLGGAAPGAANLVRFNTATPGTTVTVPVSGINTGDWLVGIAYRPQTGQFYGLGVNAGTGNGTLYVIDLQSCIANAVGSVGSVDLAADLPNPATTSGYGFAFNATVDQIRVITSVGQSFVINQNTGVVAGSDPAVTGATTTVDSAAYTNNFGQTTGVGNPTTLYTLDSATDSLYIMNPSTSVTTRVSAVTLSGATLDFSAVNGFDIPAGVNVTASGTPVTSGSGYASFVVDGTTGLYRIDLTTGAANLIGTLSSPIAGLALGDAPGGVVSFQSTTGAGSEGAAGANVVLTRTAGTGPQTVTVTMTGGTATAGTDFTGGPYTVTFPDGATTTSFTIPIAADTTVEGDETIMLTLSAAPGAALGAQTTTTLTVTDMTSPPPPPAVDRPRTLSVGGAAMGTAFAYVPAETGEYPTQPTRTTPAGVFTGFNGEVRTASGDFDGDGTEDTVLVTGFGTRTAMAVVSGKDGSVLLSPTDPFGDANYTYGGFVTAGDIDGDGRSEWVVSPELRGGPRVIIFRLDPETASGFQLVGNFFGIQDDTFRDGARVALGDLNNDGILDVFAIAAFNGGPRAGLFDGADVLGHIAAGRAPVKLTGDFFASLSGQDEGRGGRSIAAGDIDGDGRADFLVTGDNLLGTGNQVNVFSGADLTAGRFPGFGATLLASFTVSGQSPTALISVAAVNADGDERADVAAGTGAGQPSLVRVYLGKDLSGTTEPASTSFDPFGAVTANGVFVG